MRRALLACLLLFAVSAFAAAQDVFQEGTTVTVELMNGDKVTGLLVEADEARLVILHDVFGRMDIPRAAIKPTPPAPVEPVAPWTGKFDVALSGAEGNTDNQNLRIGIDGKHETDEGIDTLAAWYNRATADGETDAEKLYSLYRHEWKLDDTKWRPFVQGSFETDKFTDYDSRTSAAVGGAYPCVEGDVHKVTSRLGGGASYKSGVDGNETESLNYEALVGMDWFWTVSPTDTFSFITDVYPSINNSPEYRSVTRLAYEIKVDPDSSWYIKLGLDHYYDSDPGDDSRSADYNYFLGLGRAF